MRNLLDLSNFNYSQLSLLINKSVEYSLKKGKQTLKNKKIAFLFSEVSLRTKISFDIATQLLGGIAINVSIPHLLKENNGATREDFLDILKSLESWVDAFVIRDYSGNTLESALKYSKLPIIDAFCGKNHPTQTIADLCAIKKTIGRLNNIIICCVCPPFGSGVMESFAYGGVIMGAKIYFLTPKGKYTPVNSNFFNKIENLKNKNSRWGGGF